MNVVLISPDPGETISICRDRTTEWCQMMLASTGKAWKVEEVNDAVSVALPDHKAALLAVLALGGTLH